MSNSVIVNIPTERIHDWPSFHEVFAEAFGFFDGYGRNMDAWIDCMGTLDDAEHGLTSVHCPPGEAVYIQLVKAQEFKVRCPDILNELIECSLCVNERQSKHGQPPLIVLAYA